MAVRHIPWISPDEFLDQEAVSETKHMYYAGLVTAMAGGSVGHWTIAGNLVAALHAGLRGRGCRVGGSDLLFRTGSGDMLSYPDVMVICGQVETVPGRKNVVTNPLFVAEVCSPSTENLDRREKVREYRATPSLQQFILVSQDEPWVEIHTRDEGGRWVVEDVTGLDATCAFAGIDCSVGMAAIYEGALAR
jgi:Uma2 family endonuclease